MQIEGRLVNASNGTLLAHLISGDKSAQVIYKPIAGERPLWDFPDGNLANREYAAWLLSDLLGLDLVPPTVLRDGPFGLGSVQLWIDSQEIGELGDFHQRFESNLRAMALFDAIINNTDRKYGHLLISSENHIYGCDHGLTFHADPKLRTVLWQWAGEKFDPEERMVLEKALIVSDELAPYISERELTALKHRIAELLERNVFPEPSEEWPPVPWPPF